MSTYTINSIKTLSGTVDMKFFNYSAVAPADATLTLDILSCEIDENIEDNANQMQISTCSITAKNTGDVFRQTIFKKSGALVDARIRIDLAHAGATETIFYGIVDPTSVKYKEKAKQVEFQAFSFVDVLPSVKVADVLSFLNGTLQLGTLNGNHSLGATTLAVNAAQNYVKDGIPIDTQIKIGTYQYQVLTSSRTQITITPGLQQAESSGAIIKEPVYIFSSGGVNLAYVYDVARAIRTMMGCSILYFDAERLRFKRSGSATEYYVYDLVIQTDYFWDGAKPKESFYVYEGKEEALGILRAICNAFGLFAQVSYDRGSGKHQLLLYHRNDTVASAITLTNQGDEVNEYDWSNVFNEFTVTYPTDQEYKPTPSTPVHRTLRKKLTVADPFSGDAGNYRLRIYDGAAYAISDYRFYKASAWQSETVNGLPGALIGTDGIFHLPFMNPRELKSNKYKCVVATSGGTTRWSHLRPGNYFNGYNSESVLKKYYLRKVTRNIKTNTTELIGREE
jgi:hypothetical protein